MAVSTARIVVRPRTEQDDDFLLWLSERVFSAYAKSPARVLSGLLEDEQAQVGVAWQGAVPVGYAGIKLDRLGRPFGPVDVPVLARLDAIAVRPDAQGRGIGSRLLEWSEQTAREHGAISLSLMTAETNRKARRLFEAAGFLPVLRVEGAYSRARRGISMFKLLDR